MFNFKKPSQIILNSLNSKKTKFVEKNQNNFYSMFLHISGPISNTNVFLGLRDNVSKKNTLPSSKFISRI